MVRVLETPPPAVCGEQCTGVLLMLSHWAMLEEAAMSSAPELCCRTSEHDLGPATQSVQLNPVDHSSYRYHL